MTEWRDIESAPRDGTVFVACRSAHPKRFASVIFWHEDGDESGWAGRTVRDEVIIAHYPPTHWMPLPPPPEGGE